MNFSKQHVTKCTMPNKDQSNWIRPRVVFDCMIFLQAAARPMGPAASLLELVEVGALELLVSDATKADFLVTRDKDHWL